MDLQKSLLCETTIIKELIRSVVDSFFSVSELTGGASEKVDILERKERYSEGLGCDAYTCHDIHNKTEEIKRNINDDTS